MPISKPDAVASLIAVRESVRNCTYTLKSGIREHFCANRGFLYDICTADRIMDFLAFCKFQKLLIIIDLPYGKSVRLPPPPPYLA